MPRKIELLSPARDARCAVEAIRHGADAVYMGGPAFGARAAAGNTVADIAEVCDFAHLFGARVYVAMNTILRDDELHEAERVAWELWRAGADALIVQDMAFLRLDLPPIALHASTQMDNRTPEKARLLETAGFSQIVLARELSLSEIKVVRSAVAVPLEAFVHGALCVSYSGRCYASQYCFGRSANRGCCAQFCRLSFDLVDADGRCVVRDRHLLSLRDMNRSASLEEMMDAGVSSFKIEGRLKDVAYVKNVTAYYRRRIDEVLGRRSGDYVRASYGVSDYTFEPNPAKSFNRGFTDYFLHGRTASVHDFDTPKAKGECMGKVAAVSRRSFRLFPASVAGGSAVVAGGPAPVVGGDGLCFVDDAGKLQGFRVNKVADGEIFPAVMPPLRKGTEIYRNFDHAFDKLLSRESAVRRLRVTVRLSEVTDGYALSMCTESGHKVEKTFGAVKENARTPQRENIVRQLSKLGDTPFLAVSVSVDMAGERFVPSSRLAEWRRICTDALEAAVREACRREDNGPFRDKRRSARPVPACLPAQLDYTANVYNKVAGQVYREWGVAKVAPAFEACPPGNAVLMSCRHCLRYAFGACPHRQGDRLPWKEPLSLRLPDGREFPLQFDCKLCRMNVYAPRRD